MMKRMMAAALIAAVATVAQAPQVFAATPAPTEQKKPLLLKKKPAANPAASAAKPVPAKPKAKPGKTDPALQATRKLREAPVKQQQALGGKTQPRMINGRPCTGFLQCLFGARRVHVVRQPVRKPLLQQASLGSAPTDGGDGLSGMTTSQTIDWNETKYPVGSIIVRTPERALYFVSAKGEAIRYSVGVGREGFQWSGKSKIVRKQEWPSWTPPQVMIEREAAKGHIIPPFMEGGPGNPLGARAMYIGGTMFRVHGTNNEASIGGAVSSGCIRMMNADVMDLYDRVKVGAPIYVFQ